MAKRTLLDRKAESLARMLSEHGLSAPHAELVNLVRERRDAVAAHMGVTPATAMRYLTDEVLRQMADAVAEGLADEIPAGSVGDPWAGPERVVFPASQAGRFSWSLGLVVEAALQTGDENRARLALEALIGLSRMISEMGKGTASVFAPKEGLAYAARVLEGAAESFAAGDLSLAAPNALAGPQVSAEMASDAAALRGMVAAS
jgi:hypothetical protein